MTFFRFADIIIRLLENSPCASSSAGFLLPAFFIDIYFITLTHVAANPCGSPHFSAQNAASPFGLVSPAGSVGAGRAPLGRSTAPLREKSRSARLLGCKRPRLWYEAARIDGAGELRILIRVVLPMSIPIIATLALLVGLAYWNDWLNGLYYISDDRLFSIQVLLNRMLLDVQFLMSNSDAAKSLQQNEEFVLPSTGIRMAVAVMGALPILVVYPFFQKYFVKGIVIGAVKG